MASSFRGVVPSIIAVRGAISTLASVLAVRQVISYADAYTNVQNRLRVAGVASEDMAAATAEIFDIAQRTRTPVGELAQLYARVSLAADSLGISQRQTAEFTELVGQAIAAAGATSGEAAGALLQLSQALGGSVIQMQEFNSLIDGARPLLVAAAAGILEAEGSVDKLRQMVIEGRLSGEELFQGIAAGAQVIRTQFASTIPTVRQAMTNLNTAMTEFLGTLDQSAGGSRALAGEIQDLADALGSSEFLAFAQDTIGIIIAGVNDAKGAFEAWAELINRVKRELDGLGVPDAVGEAWGDFRQLLDDLGVPTELLFDMNAFEVASRTAESLQSKLDELAGPIVLDVDPGSELAATARELGAVQAQLATAKERRSELLTGMEEDLSSLIERFDEARAKLEEMEAGGADPRRVAEQQELVTQLRTEIEARGLANTAITAQDEAIAHLMAKELELLGILEAQTAARGQGLAASLTFERDLPSEQRVALVSPPEPPEPIKPISAGDPERGKGDGTGRRQATFADITGPIEDQLALLRDTELTENRISEIISAQGRLKRDLTAAEREALIELNTALDLETERRAVTADIAQTRARADAGGRETEALRIQLAFLEDMAKGSQEYADAMREARKEQAAAETDLQLSTMATGFEEAAEQSRLLTSYGGQQTEHYRVHLALLQARLEVGRDLTAQEARLVGLAAQAAAHEEARGRTAATMTSLRQQRERADFEISQAGALGRADILGLPPSQEAIADRKRFELMQAGESQAEIANMEPMIADLARAEQHLVLMNETAPELAGTLADLGQIAVFEGWTEAGERFTQMLVEMMFQAVALQIVMASMSAFGIGAPAATTAPPGVGPGGMGFVNVAGGPRQGLGASGFGGPRQHGGRVRQGSAYLVGEAGPEMFIPDTGGRVAPGRMAGTGGAPGITVNVNNSAQGAQVTAGRPRMGFDGRPIVDVMVADSLDRMHGGGQLDRMLGGPRTGTRRS